MLKTMLVKCAEFPTEDSGKKGWSPCRSRVMSSTFEAKEVIFAMLYAEGDVACQAPGVLRRRDLLANV